MNNDKKIVRDLANLYYQAAMSDENMEKVKLHKAVNDLKMIRPVVIVSELPWHEFNADDELDLHCEDPEMRKIEDYFRKELYKKTHFNSDEHVRPFYPVFKHGDFGSYTGLEVTQDLIHQGGYISAHGYRDVLKSEEDLKKLKWKPGFYDMEATKKQFEFTADVIADIIPVKIVGHHTLTYNIWDLISELRGAQPLLEDLIDRPEFMHKTARKFTDMYVKSVQDAVKNSLFGTEYPDLHCTAWYTNDLKPVDDPDFVKPENIWGRATAQIFGHVSAAMFKEFEMPYMAEAMEPFGLVYYGCCERLDDKLEILMKIKNLRKIGVTPWADKNVCASIIGKNYVMAVKPNPANAGFGFDEDTIRNEINEILSAAKINNCSFDIVLKDISTVNNKPQNLTRWVQIVMKMIKNY